MTTRSSNLEGYFSAEDEDNDCNNDGDDYSEFSEGSKPVNSKDHKSPRIQVTHVASHGGEDDDSYGSSKHASPKDGSFALSRSAQELSQAVMDQELDLVHQLQDREKQRTAKAQAELKDMDSQQPHQRDAHRIGQERKFERLIRRANELGIDAKLGFADPQEYTEEECFRLGATLREAEIRLTDLKTKVWAAGQQLTRREYEYNKMFNPERKEVEQRLVDFTKKLQAEEEKSSQFREKLGTLKESFAKCKEETTATRDLLLEKLVKDEEKRDKYKHICVSELVRLLLQENDTARYVMSSRSNLSKASSQRSTSGSRSLKRLKRELEYLQAKNGRLKAAVGKLDDELEQATSASIQVRSFKGRIMSLLGKQMKEKNLHFLADKATEALDKKVVLLSDHIERLMLHLKHESTDKARAHEAESLALRETELLRARIAALAKKNLRKDTVIVELQEGERILEDQLRLMDGKYVELRKVLTETRSRYKDEIDKYLQEAGRLRVRWERETQGVIPIEYVPLPRATSRSSKARSAPSGQTLSGGHGPDQPSSTYSRVPSAAVPVPLVTSGPPNPCLAGAKLEPWSDEKLTNLQQNLEIQKQLQSGRPLTTGTVTMTSTREKQPAPPRAPQPSPAPPASAPAPTVDTRPEASRCGDGGGVEGHLL